VAEATAIEPSGEKTKHSIINSIAVCRSLQTCSLCCFLCAVLLLHNPTAAFAQQETGLFSPAYSYIAESKDIWDKLSAISGLVSGIVVALIGVLATYIYNERQRRAEDSRNSRELAVQRVQTIQTFLPHLASQNELEKRGALLAISHLDDPKLASELATLFRGEGAVSALAEIAMSANREEADLARRSLGEIFQRLETSVVRVSALSDEGVVTSMVSGFVARPDGLVVTSSLIVDPSQPNTALSVRFPNENSDRRAQVIKYFPELRLLLLKVESIALEDFHALPIEETLPTAGVEIFALSFPSKDVWAPLVGRVVNPLVASEVGKQEPPLIQVEWQDERGRPGFAGMPTVNSRGHVVGMGYAWVPASADDTEEGHSLLIPAVDASRAIASIASDGDA
jgi:S1-C subfamily serine protease